MTAKRKVNITDQLEHDQAVTFARTQEELTFIKSLLEIMDRHDATDEMFWRKQSDGTFRFLIICNDLFWWGTSDCEEVTAADLETLDQAYKDAAEADQSWYGGRLYAARKRQMRPQAAYFQYFDDTIAELFKAAGPHRDDESDEMIAKYQARRGERYRRDPEMAKVEEERAAGRKYLKKLMNERQITPDDQRLIAAHLGLDHGD